MNNMYVAIYTSNTVGSECERFFFSGSGNQGAGRNQEIFVCKEIPFMLLLNHRIYHCPTAPIVLVNDIAT